MRTSGVTILLAFVLALAGIARADIWGNETIIDVTDPMGGDMGQSLAIDGDYAISGDRFGWINESQMGTAFIFERDIDGVWRQAAFLTASDLFIGLPRIILK